MIAQSPSAFPGFNKLLKFLTTLQWTRLLVRYQSSKVLLRDMFHHKKLLNLVWNRTWMSSHPTGPIRFSSPTRPTFSTQDSSTSCSAEQPDEQACSRDTNRTSYCSWICFTTESCSTWFETGRDAFNICTNPCKTCVDFWTFGQSGYQARWNSVWESLERKGKRIIDRTEFSIFCL